MKWHGFDVAVLRLGHRPHRDMRVTTHVALVARAFGADAAIVADVKDPTLEATIRKVTQKWGGTFTLTTGLPWRKVVAEWKNHGGEIIHLTMYGENVDEQIDSIRSSPKNKLVIVGGSKVPGEVYSLADYNIAITHQPHSEVAALSIFFDRLYQGRELSEDFQNSKFAAESALRPRPATSHKGRAIGAKRGAVEPWTRNC